MSAYPQTKQDKALGRFLLISFALHLLILFFYPKWHASPLQGTLPGEGAIQMTLRQSPEAQALDMRSVTPQRVPTPPTPRPQPQPRPVERQPEPAQVQSPTPVSPPVVAEAVAPVQPQVRPQPTPQAPPREVAQVEQVAPPRPQPTAMPVETTPVVTSPAGTTPVASQSEAGATGEPNDGAGEAASAIEEAPAEPAPPPAPPTVGSLFTLPGGQRLPKNLEDAENMRSMVSVRVIVTIDENGGIIRSEVDPNRRSDVALANQYAVLYAEQMVRNQPMAQGQAYQAAFVVTFDPNAIDPTLGMVLSTEDDERIRFLDSD